MDDDHVEPPVIAVRIKRAAGLLGISRSKLYELIRDGELSKVKVGQSTLVPYASLVRLIERGLNPTGPNKPRRSRR